MDHDRAVVEVDRRARDTIWNWKTLSRSRSTAHRAHGRQRIHRQARREWETRGIVRARIERLRHRERRVACTAVRWAAPPRNAISWTLRPPILQHFEHVAFRSETVRPEGHVKRKP